MKPHGSIRSFWLTFFLPSPLRGLIRLSHKVPAVDLKKKTKILLTIKDYLNDINLYFFVKNPIFDKLPRSFLFFQVQLKGGQVGAFKAVTISHSASSCLGNSLVERFSGRLMQLGSWPTYKLSNQFARKWMFRS